MLGLREEVHRHPIRVAAAIRHHQNFGWPGHHINPDNAENPALGTGDIGVAWPDNLVHLRDRRRAVSQCTDRLRAANRKHPINARQASRRHHQRVLLATRRRHHHDQFLDARHLGRNRVHQH